MNIRVWFDFFLGCFGVYLVGGVVGLVVLIMLGLRLGWYDNLVK